MHDNPINKEKYGNTTSETIPPKKSKDKDKDGISDSDEEYGEISSKLAKQMVKTNDDEVKKQIATFQQFLKDRKLLKEVKKQNPTSAEIEKDNEFKMLNNKKVISAEDKEKEVSANPNVLPTTKQANSYGAKTSSSKPLSETINVDNPMNLDAKIDIPKDSDTITTINESKPNMSGNVTLLMKENGIINELTDRLDKTIVERSIETLIAERQDTTFYGNFTVSSSYNPNKLFSWISNKIPSLFSFVSYHNPLLESNDERINENFALGGLLTEQMRNSIELVKDGTYAITLVFDPKNLNLDLTESDVNYYKQVVVVGSQYDSNTTVQELSSRLERIAKLVNSSFILIKDITKNKIEETVTNNIIYAGLETLLEGDNPHPYLGSRYHKCTWFTKELERIYAKAPIYIAETNATSDNAHKVYSTYHCITDQYTSHFQNNAFNLLERNVLRLESYQYKLAANTYRNSEIIDREARDPNFRKYFEPPQHAWDLMMFRFMSDPVYLNFAIEKLIHHVKHTNTFEIEDPAPFIRLLNYATVAGDPSIRKIFNTFPSLSIDTFCTLYTLEHFAWKYKVTFESSVELDIDSAIPEIFSILSTILFFPKLFQRGSNSLLYRLMRCLETLDRRGMVGMFNKFGYQIQINDDGTLGEVHVKDILMPISYDELIAGTTYSIATPSKNFQFEGKTKLLNIINKIINRKLDTNVLTRKKAASYPYMDDSYVTSLSYGKVYDNMFDQRYINEYVGMFRELINAVSAAYDKQKKSSGDSVMNVNTRRVYQQYLTNLNTLCNTISPVFWSLAQLSDVIQNSWIYVYDGYNVNSPVIPNRDFGITVDDSNAYAGVGRLDLENLRISSLVGGSLFLGLKGGYIRPTIEATNRANIELKEFITRTSIIPFPAKEWTDLSYLLSQDSYKFGVAMGLFLKFVQLAKGEKDGEEYEFLRHYRKFFQMRSFAAILDSISGIFSVNLRTVFGTSMIAGNLRDLRSDKIVLTELDRESIEPAIRQGTRFNRPWTWTDEITDDTITTATRLLLLDESPVHFISRGLILCRVKDQLITPHYDIKPPRLTLDYTTDLFKYSSEGETKGIIMEFYDEKGEYQKVIQPFDERLDNVRIKVKNIGDINVEWKDFILQSLSEGRLSLEIVNIDYRYKIGYWTTNSQDIPGTFDNARKVFMSQGGEYVDVMFYNTIYAKRSKVFSIGTHVYTTYVFPLNPDIDTGEVISAIYDPVTKPQEFQIDNGEQFGHSPARGRNKNKSNYLPISSIPKLLSARPNMNNTLKVYTSFPEFEGQIDMTVRPPANL